MYPEQPWEKAGNRHPPQGPGSVASHTAIADVGQTVVSLLRDRTGEAIDDEDIVLASPAADEPGEDVRLTVYLYDVRENEHLSNDRSRPRATGSPAGAALVLDLYYLLTAHPKTNGSSSEATTRTAEQHEVLGRAMQILADNAVVRRPDLEEDLTEGDALSVSIATTDRRDLLDIWGTFEDVPYRPSVAYVVSPVVIDSERARDGPRVLEARFDEFTHRPVGEDAPE